MILPDYKERAERYRKRAKEIRATAEEMANEESRRILLRLARDYDVLADRIEKTGDNGPTGKTQPKKKSP